MPRKTLKDLIEKRVGKSFRDVILENVPVGTGRYESAKIIEDVCEKYRKPGEEYLKVLHSTLWYCVKRSKENGDFLSDPNDKESGFVFTFNHNGNKYNKNINRDLKTLTIKCNWFCLNCKNKWFSEEKVQSLDLFSLRTQICPRCDEHGVDSFDKVILQFQYNGIRAIKAVLMVEERMRECFVDKNLKRIDSPFG